MSRRVRNDLSYFTVDCDIFSAKSNLAPLISRFNGDGFMLYVHILCDVYGTGYYYKPKNYEDYLYQLAKDCGITVEKVQLIIAFMASRSLLDANCLNKNTVFTSHGIQERYAEAMKGRKRSIAEIKGDYWLLSEKEEAEIDTFYKSHSFVNKSENNGDKSENNGTTEQNRTEQKETNIEVSKKVSNKKESIESYDEIFEELYVPARLKTAIIEFIRHLKVSFDITVLNDRLENLIIELDKKYQNDVLAKCQEVRRAIVNGYKRLECEEI